MAAGCASSFINFFFVFLFQLQYTWDNDGVCVCWGVNLVPFGFRFWCWGCGYCVMGCVWAGLFFMASIVLTSLGCWVFFVRAVMCYSGSFPDTKALCFKYRGNLLRH